MAKLDRVGVFGGTFDPPHRGHIAIAQCALEQLRLDVVWWLPVGSPPHKTGLDVSSVDHRFEMVRLTLDRVANPAFILLSTDRDRSGPHFMVDTIDILKREFSPGEIFLIIGEDTLYDLPTWSRPNKLVELVTFAVYPRGNGHPPLESLEGQLPAIEGKLKFLTGESVQASSTKIRDRAQNNQVLTEWLVPEVEHYIASHDLYAKSYAE